MVHILGAPPVIDDLKLQVHRETICTVIEHNNIPVINVTGHLVFQVGFRFTKFPIEGQRCTNVLDQTITKNISGSRTLFTIPNGMNWEDSYAKTVTIHQ